MGAALRALRKEQRLSLQDVSAATDISVSFLSLVENDKSDITIGRLMRLAGFYGVHISDLIPTPNGREPIVIRKSERQHIVSPTEGIDVYLLGPDGQHRMLPLIAQFAPGGGLAERSQHEGEEYVYVLDGKVELSVEGADAVLLEVGDGAYFHADRPHQIRGVSKKPARVFIVVAPPHM
jgi:transcriptional regulator with XRE-family HTH domain